MRRELKEWGGLDGKNEMEMKGLVVRWLVGNGDGRQQSVLRT